VEYNGDARILSGSTNIAVYVQAQYKFDQNCPEQLARHRSPLN